MIDYEIVRTSLSRIRVDVTRTSFAKGYREVTTIKEFDSYDHNDPEQDAIDYIASMEDDED